MKLWFQRKMHVSWLVAAMSLGVVISIMVVPILSPGVTGSPGWLLSGLILGVFSLWRARRWCLLVAVTAGLLIGGWRGSSVQAEFTPYQSISGQEVTVKGVVSEDVDIGRGGQLVLRLKNITIDERKLPGVLWVTMAAGPDIKRSDIVTVEGGLSEGFGGFVASIYRGSLQEIERPEPGDRALYLRDEFADSVREVVPEPQASLGIGYLVGQRRALPPELDEALRVVGLTHVVVASGYNLTILVRLARRLFVKVSKYLAAVAAGGMVVAFIAVTGISPSMSRAGLVAGLSLLAWYYGRRFHPLVLLPFAAAITLIVNPSYGWSDLGWQLSFAAFAGVMILAPLLQAYFFGDEKPGVVRQILGETVSAQLFTLPIIAATFGVVSMVALLANLLVLPLVPLAMLLTFIAGVSAIFMPAIADTVAQPAVWLLGYMTEVATRAANLPWAQVEVEMGGWVVAGTYALIVAACVYMRLKTDSSLRNYNIIE